MTPIELVCLHTLYLNTWMLVSVNGVLPTLPTTSPPTTPEEDHLRACAMSLAVVRSREKHLGPDTLAEFSEAIRGASALPAAS